MKISKRGPPIPSCAPHVTSYATGMGRVTCKESSLHFKTEFTECSLCHQTYMYLQHVRTGNVKKPPSYAVALALAGLSFGLIHSQKRGLCTRVAVRGRCDGRGGRYQNLPVPLVTCTCLLAVLQFILPPSGDVRGLSGWQGCFCF